MPTLWYGKRKLSGPASGNRSSHNERQAQIRRESGIMRPVPAAVLTAEIIGSIIWQLLSPIQQNRDTRRRLQSNTEQSIHIQASCR